MRLFRTSPGVAASAIVALAMGIGFTTTMFGIVHGATRPLPVEHPETVVAIEKVSRHGAVRDTSSRAFDFAAWREARSLESIGAFQTTAANLSADSDQPERVSGAQITSNAFAILNLHAAMGRTLTAADDQPGADAVVVLADSLWKRRYGADPRIVGRAIRVDGRPHVVVGVMPPRIGFPINASLWVPLPIQISSGPGEGPSLIVFGRLRSGLTIESARAELETGLTARTTAYPDADAGVGVRVLPFTEIETPREVIRGLQLLVFAVSFVLLIACGNVAGLLVVRGVARVRETATRIALGASRRRLVVEQLAESLTLSAIAAVAGLGIAHLAVRAFAVNTSDIIEAFWVDFRVDGTVVLFASSLAAIAATAAGLGPALRISSTNAIDVLKDRSMGSTGARLGRVARRLPGAQIAMTCGLLALTVVLGRAALGMRTMEWPFDSTRILSAQYGLTLDTLRDRERRNRVITELATGLERQPGVAAAGLVSALPGKGSGEWSISIDQPAEQGRPSAATTSVAFVTPGFFDVVGARTLEGRSLTWQDDSSAPDVAVVNRSFAQRFWPDRPAIGRRVFLGARGMTVVGVVPDLKARDIQERRQDGLYAPMLQHRPYAVRVVARGTGSAMDLVAALRRDTARVDPDLPLYEIFSLREAALRDKAVLDVLSSLFLLFGVGALGLTAIGLYGVVSFAVAQRTREFGIRMALGATQRHIAQMVVRQGGAQVLIGLGAGIVLAVALTRAFSAAVENAPPSDIRVLVVIVAVVAVTAVCAMAVPARRAISIEIARALRES